MAGRLVGALLACVFTAVAARGVTEADLLPGIDGRWHHYQSPNFELYSHDSERDARAILHDLEMLRAVFFTQFGLTERRRLEVTVYAFRTSAEFEAYAGAGRKKELAGMYVARPDRAVILLRPMEERTLSRRVVFHEYVHHLFTAGGEDPPLWFNEGMAELLGGIQINGGKVTIGHPLADRLVGLQHENLLPLETLFDVGVDSKHYQSNSHAGLFYAQSWALLHYLRFGKSKFDRAAVDRFLRIAGDKQALARTNMRSLFEECFGLDYEAMRKQLQRYVRQGSYQYGSVPTPAIPASDSYERNVVSTEVMRRRLAELAVRVHQSAAGRAVLLEAATADAVEPRVFEALGADAMRQGEVDEAIAYWDRAADAGSRNSAVLREAARFEWQRWFDPFNQNLRLPDDVAKRLRGRLHGSIEAEPTQDDAFEMLAWVEAFATVPLPANLNLVQRRLPELRKKGKTFLALALARVRLDRKEEAIKLLKLINQFDPDDWTLEAAEVVLATLEGRPIEPVALVRDREAKRTGVGKVTESITRLPSVPVPQDL